MTQVHFHKCKLIIQKHLSQGETMYILDLSIA